MINPILFVCADTIIRDAQTNNISVINILEEFHPEIFPILIPRITILLILERDQEDPLAPDVRLIVTLADEEIFSTPMNTDFQQRLRTRSIVVIGGLAITRPGILRFRALIEERILGDCKVRISTPAHPRVENQSST